MVAGLSQRTRSERIQQATYNIFADMGVQPDDPRRASSLDPGGPTRPPTPPSRRPRTRPKPATTVTFNAAASNDPDGTIAKYEWDLDGNGSYETNTGTKSSTTHSYAAEGNYTVRLRVTDNGGATDLRCGP